MRLSWIYWFLVLVLIVLTVNIDCKKKTRKASRKIEEKKTDKLKKDGRLKKNEKGDKTNSVSSDKVNNGGNKGPMSGNINQGVPNPFQIPFPIIPKAKKAKNNHKGKVKSENQKDQPTAGKGAQGVKNKHGPSSNSGSKTGPLQVVTESKRSTVEDNTFEPLETSEVIRRMRRDVDDDNFSDEERKLRDEWLQFDLHDNNIPNAEGASFLPSDLNFIWEARKSLSDAYDTIMPHVKERLQKRSVAENDDIVELSKPSTSVIKSEDDLMSLNKIMDSDVRVQKKRDVTDYDVAGEEVNDSDEDLVSVSSEADMSRDMRVREISPAEEEYSEEAVEIVDDSDDGDFLEPIHHNIGTREALSRDGRSVRFE